MTCCESFPEVTIGQVFSRMLSSHQKLPVVLCFNNRFRRNSSKSQFACSEDQLHFSSEAACTVGLCEITSIVSVHPSYVLFQSQGLWAPSYGILRQSSKQVCDSRNAIFQASLEETSSNYI